MKQLTKKHRGEIYLKAAELLLQKDAVCCWLLTCAITGKQDECFSYETEQICEMMPEFALFIPNHGGLRWWDTFTDGVNENESRLNALLLCYEMTKS